MKIALPTHLKEIGIQSFYGSSLSKIVINEDAELESISESAFENSCVTSFHVTKHLKNIGNGAFASIGKFKIIEIPEFSILENINLNMLNKFYETLLMIPVAFKDKIIAFEEENSGEWS